MFGPLCSSVQLQNEVTISRNSAWDVIAQSNVQQREHALLVAV
jgi:hypothetical protein